MIKENIINVLLLEDGDEIKNLLVELNSVDVTKIRKDLDLIEQTMKSNKFIDVVLIHILESSFDDIAYLSNVVKIVAKYIKTKIVVATHFISPFFQEELVRNFVDYIIILPKDKMRIEEDLKRLSLNNHTNNITYDGKLDNEIRRILMDLGFSAHFDGFEYLRVALTLIHHDPSLKDNIIKGVYANVALYFNTDCGRIERAIRTAIRLSILQADKDTYGEIFQLGKHDEMHIPTNSEFLLCCYNYLQICFNNRGIRKYLV